MARLKSLTYVGTNTIPFEASSFYVSSGLTKSDLDDSFASGIDVSLWSESLTNCTTTVDNFHEVVFGAGSSVYELVGGTIPGSASTCFEYGYKYKKTGSTSGDVTAHRLRMTDTVNNVDISFLYNDATSNRLEITDGTTTINHAISSLLCKMKIIKVGDEFYFMVDEGTGYEYVGNLSISLSNLSIEILSSDPATTGSVLYLPFTQLPIVSGVSSRGEIPVPVPVRKQGTKTSYIISPYLPGEFEVTTHGSGSSSGSSESAGTIKVLLDKRSIMRPRFLVSEVENMVSDGSEIAVCPSFGVPNDGNRGDFVLTNECFCDGSPKDTDAVNFLFKKTARSSKSVVRKKMPEFFADDGVNVLGRNNDFLRVHHPDSDLDLATAGERLAFLRTLKLSDGRVIYYGVAKQEDTAQNIYAQFGYDISYYQSLDTGVDRDQWSWTLYGEDGSSIIAASDDPIYYSTRTALNNYFDNAGGNYRNLAPGRYFLEISAMRYSDSDNGEEDPANEGARMTVTLRQGTTGVSPIIAEGFAEAKEITDESSFAQPNNFGNCIVQFTVEERLGRLVVYEFDPCSNLITKYESASTDVDLRTKSLIAFEHGEDVVFAYHKVSSNFYEERSGVLSYVRFNSGFADTGEIAIPGVGISSYLYAFDAYAKNGVLQCYAALESVDDYIYAQVRVGDSSFTRRTLQRSKPFSPCGPRGIYHYSFDISDITFDGSNYSFRDYESNRITLDSLQSMFSQESTARFYYNDETYEKEHFVKWDFPQRIRVKHSEDYNLTVMSVLDLDTRAPVILMGNAGRMKEVAIPLHFDMYEDMPTSRSPSRLTHYAIDDFCASLSPDGMIYSIASKDEIVEIGLNDPSFYWEGDDVLVKIEQDYYSRAPYRMYSPPVRFEAIPFHSLDNGDSTNEKIFVDIDTNHHYVTCITQAENDAYTPCVYASGFYDNVPFETFCENVWIPCLEDTASAYTSINASHEGYAVRLRNFSGVKSSIEAVLDSVTCHKDKYWYLDIGYKVHARLLIYPHTGGGGSGPGAHAGDGGGGASGFGGGTTVHEPVEFYANFEKDYLRRGLASFWISGDTAEARVYDYGSSSWQVVETFTGLPIQPLDFYILIQSPEGDTGRAVFVIKKPASLSTLYESDQHTLEWSSVSEIGFGYDFKLDTGYVADESTFGVKWDQNTSGSNRHEYCYVYQLGYNTLKASTGVDELQSVPKGGGSVDVYTSDHFDGQRLMSLDDSKLFDYNGFPQYGFPIYSFFGQKSHSYHWYNGFSYRWSGSVAYLDDSFSLARPLLNSPEEALSKNLHGMWLSSTDDASVILSCDSNSDGFEKYVSDTFVVSGVNVPDINVYGRDDTADPWTSIGSIDMRLFRIESPSYQQGADKCVITKEGMDLPYGFSKQEPGYIYDGTQCLKVISNTETEILVEKPSGYTVSADTVWYLKKGAALTTKEKHSYRYIGFEFVAVDTFEGYFMAENVDFGYGTQLPSGVNYDLGGGRTLEVVVNHAILYDSQPHKFAPSVISSPSYQFTFSTADPATFARMMTMFDRVDYNRKPIWVIEEFSSDSGRVCLTLPTSEVSSQVLLDDGDDSLFTVSFDMKGVSE